MRIKLNDVSSMCGQWHYRTSASISESGAGYQIMKSVSANHNSPLYKETTEWQTIYIDTSADSGLLYLNNAQGEASAWSSFSFRIFSHYADSYEEDARPNSAVDIAYIAWIGAFKSMEDVYAASGEAMPEKTVIACVGDSITYGTASTNPSKNSYPAQLQKRLGDNYEVLNFGMPGHTAVIGSKYTYVYTDTYQDSLNCSPDIVVLMLGTNDAVGYWSTLGSMYKQDLTELIKTYQNLPGKPTVYLCTTPYVDETARPAAVGKNTIIRSEAIPIQQEVAAELGCKLISMYALFDDKTELLADGCHPNDNGYEVMADKVYNALFDTKYGDTNGDSVININDLIRLKKALAGLSSYVRATSDISFDGIVNSVDVVIMKKYLLGVINSFGGDDIEATNAQLASDMASIKLNNLSNALKINSTVSSVSDYNAEWDFSHHASIVKFKDKFYAMWSSGHDAEDNCGQRVLIAISDDAAIWSEPTVLVDTAMGDNSELVSYAIGLYTNGETLVAYYHTFEYKSTVLQENGTFRPESNGYHINSGNYLVHTTDGVNWSEPISLNYERSLSCPPEKTSDGRLIMMGAGNYLYTSDLSGLTGWTASSISTYSVNKIIESGEVKTFTEGNTYKLADGTLRLVFRTNSDYLWCAESSDGGLTWTSPYKTGITDDHAKSVFGTLPDGRYYYLGNPVIDGNRLPLVLGVSEDGNNFESYILRDEPYTIQSSGLYKNGHYAYPSVCFDDEYMYIIYSKGKEVIEVTKISLDDI